MRTYNLVGVSAALNMACGAGLPVMATATILGYFLIMFAYPRLVRRVLPLASATGALVVIEYHDRKTLPEHILSLRGNLRFSVEHMEVDRRGGSYVNSEDIRNLADEQRQAVAIRVTGIATLTMQVSGRQPAALLIARLSALVGVVWVGNSEADGSLE